MRKFIYCFLISVSYWGQGCVEVARAGVNCDFSVDTEAAHFVRVDACKTVPGDFLCIVKRQGEFGDCFFIEASLSPEKKEERTFYQRLCNLSIKKACDKFHELGGK